MNMNNVIVEKRSSRWARMGKLTLALVALLLAIPSGVFAADDEGNTPWTTYLGGGGVFYQGNERNYSGQLYDLRQSYDLSPAMSLEFGVGGAPYLEERDNLDWSQDPLYTGESWNVRGSLGALYHFNQEAERTWDPYVGLGGGMYYSGKKMFPGDKPWEPYYGGNVGLGYNINKSWSVRADYFLAAASAYDPVVNQYALAMLGYRWGAGEEGEEAKGKGLFEESQQKLQTVHFAYDSAVLNDTAKQKLRENTTWMQAQENAKKKVRIEGHCDERGTVEYNMALGQRRANSAFEFVRSLGVPVERMSTVSFGKEKPVDPGHNEAAWAQNRRAETVVLGE